MKALLEPADCQPELALREQAARTGNAEAVRELCGLLQGRGWMKAREIRDLRPAWSKRFIRRLASASGLRIVSAPGSKGYCLAEAVTTDELGRACDKLQSQIRKMAQRLIAYRRLLAPLRRAQALLISAQQ